MAKNATDAHTITTDAGLLTKVDTQPYSEALNFDVDVPAAQPGTLTVRTNGTDGTLTMTNSGHGIVTGQVIDIYWTDPTTGALMGRRNVTVGTVAGTTVPFTSSGGGGAGDNLPVVNTAVNAAAQVLKDCAVTGNNVVGIQQWLPDSGTYLGVFGFFSGVPAEIASQRFQGGQSYSWLSVQGAANPLAAATVAKLRLSHGDINNAHKFKCSVLFN